MSTVTSAKLYVRMALLRRRVLLRQAIGRALAGALAVAGMKHWVDAGGRGEHWLLHRPSGGGRRRILCRTARGEGNPQRQQRG